MNLLKQIERRKRLIYEIIINLQVPILETSTYHIGVVIGNFVRKPG